MKTMKATKAAVPLERLLEQLPENYSIADRELIQRAYRVAEEAHQDQKRLSGEPYINHCLSVASILADLRVPPDVVAPPVFSCFLPTAPGWVPFRQLQSMKSP